MEWGTGLVREGFRMFDWIFKVDSLCKEQRRQGGEV